MNGNTVISIVERIEDLEKEQKALLEGKRNIYTEATKAGINAKALRQVVAERRMKDREQFEAHKRALRIALGMAVNDVAEGASLREAAAKHGVAKSTLHRAVPREEKIEMGRPQGDDYRAVPRETKSKIEQPPEDDSPGISVVSGPQT